MISTRGVSLSFGITMFCKANIVAEGGVLSPSMGFRGGLDRWLGVSLPVSRLIGVGVLDRPESLSFEWFSLRRPGVRGRRSGDFSGDGDRSSDFRASV